MATVFQKVYLSQITEGSLRDLYVSIGRCDPKEVRGNLADFQSWAAAIEAEFGQRNMTYDVIDVGAIARG